MEVLHGICPTNFQFEGAKLFCYIVGRMNRSEGDVTGRSRASLKRKTAHDDHLRRGRGRPKKGLSTFGKGMWNSPVWKNKENRLKEHVDKDWRELSREHQLYYIQLKKSTEKQTDDRLKNSVSPKEQSLEFDQEAYANVESSPKEESLDFDQEAYANEDCIETPVPCESDNIQRLEVIGHDFKPSINLRHFQPYFNAPTRNFIAGQFSREGCTLSVIDSGVKCLFRLSLEQVRIGKDTSCDLHGALLSVYITLNKRNGRWFVKNLSPNDECYLLAMTTGTPHRMKLVSQELEIRHLDFLLLAGFRFSFSDHAFAW